MLEELFRELEGQLNWLKGGEINLKGRCGG